MNYEACESFMGFCDDMMIDVATESISNEKPPSKNTKTYNIWGRDCKVKVIFDCYKGEEIDNIQKEAISDFESNVQRYAQLGLKEIKKYILKNYRSDIEDPDLSNIFKYAVPKTLFVSKDPSNKKVIGLICHFKFDDENNIAIKYVNGKVVGVGGEQIIL